MAVQEFTVQRAFQVDQRSPVRWVLSHALRHRWPLVMFGAGAFFNALLAALPALFIGNAFNSLLANPPDLRGLGTATFWIVVTQVVRGAILLSRNFGVEIVGQRLERDVRDELYASLLGKSMTFHSLRPVGEIMARATNDVREMNLMMNPGLNLVIGSANFMIMPLIFSLRYHPALMLTPALFILAYGLALWQYLRELRPITGRVRQGFGTMNAGLAEAVEASKP